MTPCATRQYACVVHNCGFCVPLDADGSPRLSFFSPVPPAEASASNKGTGDDRTKVASNDQGAGRMGNPEEAKVRGDRGGAETDMPKELEEPKTLKEPEKGQKRAEESDQEGGGGEESQKEEREEQEGSEGKGDTEKGRKEEEGGEDEEDEEDGSRMDLLSDLREEQRARRKGGGRSVSALMGVRRRNKELDALVIKGKGNFIFCYFFKFV